MQKKGASYKMVIITACIPFIIALAGCKKSWTPPKASATPTRSVTVMDPEEASKNKNDSTLVPVTTLFPGRYGQEGTLTPTPTFTPTPTPVTVIVTRPPEDPEPSGEPEPSATPVPTPKPTNTPRPTRVPPTPVATPAEPSPTPTPGTVDFTLVTGTPTPRVR